MSLQIERIDYIKDLTNRVNLNLFGVDFAIIVSYDLLYGNRIFIQLAYQDTCSKTGEKKPWKSRKWYLSDYMEDDEIIKTCYLAFETCVKHEILENFKVDGKALFNPHIDFEELLKITKERKR